MNAVGTANIAKACKASKVGKLIYFQTALCYGTNPEQSPIQLDHPIKPVNSSYAISKTAGEHYVQFSGVDWTTFRLANVIGPRNVSGPLPIFYKWLSQGRRCFVTTARRDFCYAGDLAAVVVRSIDGTGTGTYHFSSGRDVAIKQLYDAVVKAMKLNHYPEPEIRPLGPDEAPSILLDPSRTFEDFGEVKFTALDEIVRIAVEHWRTFGVEGGYSHLREVARLSGEQTRRVAGPASIVVVLGARPSGTICDQKDPFGRGGSTAIHQGSAFVAGNGAASRPDRDHGPYRTAFQFRDVGRLLRRARHRQARLSF